MLYQHPCCSCAAFGGSSPSNRGSFRAWRRVEGGADSLPPLDEFMGCDIGSQGSLCSQERRRRLLYLFMKQFIRWGGSHRVPPRQAGAAGAARTRVGGAEPRVLPGRWVPARGAAEGLPPLCSTRHAVGVMCVCARTRVSHCRWEMPWPGLPTLPQLRSPSGAGSIPRGCAAGLSSTPGPGHPHGSALGWQSHSWG